MRAAVDEFLAARLGTRWVERITPPLVAGSILTVDASGAGGVLSRAA